MPLLALDRLTKTFPGPVAAVEQLSLEVADGELMVLMGPSGCGKTTTLRMIAGLEKPTAGHVCFEGRALDGLAPRDRDMAMVFQSAPLYPHLDVRRNIDFGLRLRRLRRQARQERLTTAASLVGIERLLGRRPHELSGGQRQRVCLARAIARRPKLFLFDEPLAHLDAPARLELRQEIRRLQRQLGTAALYVTHDATEAMALADRVAVLDQGRLQQVGCPQAIYDRPANRRVAALIGSHPMAFLCGRVCVDEGCMHVDVAAAEGRLRIALPNALAAGLKLERAADITLGLRPEHVRLLPPDSETSPGLKVPVVIETAERQGALSWVTLSAAGVLLASLVPGHKVLQRGTRMLAVIDPECVLIFDAATGAALPPSLPGC
ncbi:MAG: ABC transporter ATP-binding protein [Planctomycetota bacterium]